MKVKELVTMLQAMDQEAEVCYADDGGDTMSIDSIFGFGPVQEIAQGIEDVEDGKTVVLFAPSF